ncbi:MAG: sigma-70 family RNA polymerase sigma factor [Acidobacteriota bacterium]
MPDTQPANITVLLQRSRMGDEAAMRELMPIVYDTLRQAARRELQHERGNHTLQPTALLHEAWMRLFNADSQSTYQWKDRAHFMAVAARQMRLILVDYARAKHAVKRDGQQQIDLTEDIIVGLPISEDLLALDEALTRLAIELPRAAQVVELRYIGGLTEEETAEALAISVATVKRDWKFARGWLFNQLKPK